MRTSIVAVEVDLIAPIISRHASLCSLIKCIRMKYLTLGHHTMEPQVKMGLITML